MINVAQGRQEVKLRCSTGTLGPPLDPSKEVTGDVVFAYWVSIK